MLTFLSKIRKSLIATGSAQKYMLYAIGEIALVVIGILIALQINNWNEWRIDRQEEYKLLIRLHNEFQINKIEFDRTDSLNRDIILNVDRMIATLPYVKSLDRDSLSRVFSWFFGGVATFNPSNSIINGIINSNSINLISNDSLKEKILGWNSILEDYLEEVKSTKNFAIEVFEQYLLDNGIPARGNLRNERVDLGFLTTLKFESLLLKRRSQMVNISSATRNPISMREFLQLEKMMDDIIKLSTP